MKWIKIEDAQPEIHEYRPGSETGNSDAVLVFLDGETENGSQFGVWRMYRGGRGDTTSIYWDWDYPNVTHWMPISPPVKIDPVQTNHLVLEVSGSGIQLTCEFIDSLSTHPILVCIGRQTTTGEIDLQKVAAKLVDIEVVGDGLGAKKYAHLEVFPKTQMGSLLNSFDPRMLLVNFSSFSFKDGELVPGYVEILPK